MSEVFDVVKTMVVDLNTKANTISKEVQDSRVNVNKAVHEFRNDEESPHDWIRKYQTWKEQADAQIEKRTQELEARIKSELVKTSAMSDEVFEAKKAEYTELKKASKAALELAAKLPGYDAKVFEDVPALQTLSGATAGSSTGVKRARLASLTIDGKEVFVTVKDKDGTESKSYTFTNAAAYLTKVSKKTVKPSDLSGAALEAAKTDNLSNVTDVKFSYSVDGTGYMIEAITAKAVEKPATPADK